METWAWMAQNWFELASTIGIIGGLVGLWLTFKAIRDETKARRVGNLLTLTSNHQELLKVFYQGVPLDRVFDTAVDISSQPINLGEEMYVNALIQHLFSVYRAMQDDLTAKPQQLQRDIQDVFTLPIPKMVWEKLKPFQDGDFIAFIESCWHPTSTANN